jgi:hypothetical protein
MAVSLKVMAAQEIGKGRHIHRDRSIFQAWQWPATHFDCARTAQAMHCSKNDHLLQA